MNPVRVFRFLFVLYCFVTLVFAFIFSRLDFTAFVPATLLFVGIVFYIIAIVALQVMHQKEARSLNDLLLVIGYPYLVYFLMFFSLNYRDQQLWIIVGFFYFLVLTAGFVLGIVLSPLIAKLKEFPKEEIRGHLRFGIEFLKRGRGIGDALFLLIGIFIALVYFYARFLLRFSHLSLYQAFVFYFFLLLGIIAVVKFTFRHTVFNIARDPELKRKYDEERESKY